MYKVFISSPACARCSIECCVQCSSYLRSIRRHCIPLLLLWNVLFVWIHHINYITKYYHERLVAGVQALHEHSQPPSLYAICILMLTSNVFNCLQISTMSPSLTEKISRLHRKNWIIIENNSILACIVRSLLCFNLLFTQTISMIDCQSMLLCTACKYYCLYKQFNRMSVCIIPNQAMYAAFWREHQFNVYIINSDNFEWKKFHLIYIYIYVAQMNFHLFNEALCLWCIVCMPISSERSWPFRNFSK